jgi:HSP20 family protein
MAKHRKEKESKEVAPWRPFSDIVRWEGDLARMFDDLFERRWPSFRGERWWPMKSARAGAPAVDVYEEGDEIIAKVELPGIAREDIEVEVRGNFLVIKGEKRKEEEIKEADYYRSERSYGYFARSVELPHEAQADRAKATFKNGVLEIRLPKSEEAKKKETKIRIE